MVTFSCDGCNEIMKKKQVDSHAARCRRCASVTCVDCSKSFHGDDYRMHTTCEMTEVDNLVAARGAKNKKLSPQEAWMELLHSSVDAAPPTIKSYLKNIIQLDNVPRKEKQFRNFATNSLNFRGNNAKKELDSIWNFLKEQKEKQQKQKEEQQTKQQKVKEEQAAEKLLQQKATVAGDKAETASDTENVSDDKATYKNVKKATKKMLKKAPGQSMKFKSLQKGLRGKLGVPKKKLKEVMDQVVAKESKKFMLEGKQIKLVVS